jgi:AcrR family transcriptional regulator
MMPAVDDEPVTERPRRRDAQRNRERVIAAATEVLARDGLDAAVPEIARVAGVGKGTVYRNFATKEELAVAVAVARLDGFERRLAEVLATDCSPADQLRTLVLAIVDRIRPDRSLGEVVEAVADDPEVAAAHQRLWARTAEALEGAQRAGVARDDVDATDVTVLLSAVARTLPPLNLGGRPEVWDRYALLLLDALRPGGSPLPAGFTDLAEMRSSMQPARGRRP